MIPVLLRHQFYLRISSVLLRFVLLYRILRVHLLSAEPCDTLGFHQTFTHRTDVNVTFRYFFDGAILFFQNHHQSFDTQTETNSTCGFAAAFFYQIVVTTAATNSQTIGYKFKYSSCIVVQTTNDFGVNDKFDTPFLSGLSCTFWKCAVHSSSRQSSTEGAFAITA